MLPDTTLLFDFDSTLTQVEALDVLGTITIHGSDRQTKLDKIASITNLGMSGKLSFRESLVERMNVINANKDDITELVEILKNKVSKSIEQHQAFFKTNFEHIHIVSSGFREFIEPVVSNFGITPDHIHANTFIWDANNRMVGFDKDNPLSKDKGKPELVQQLELSGKVVVIGDGYTDYEIKESGQADVFVAYTENISRPEVIAKADFEATNFNDFLNFISHV